MDFTRFGGDLLSQGLSPSTIGATVLNFRVRDGTGCFTCAVATKPRKIQAPEAVGFSRLAVGSVFAEQMRERQQLSYVTMTFPNASGVQSTVQVLGMVCLFGFATLSVTGSNQAYRAISTGQLNALLRLHLRPIGVVVFHGPQ